MRTVKKSTGGSRMSRRTAREEAFKLLYQIDIQKEDKNVILNDYFLDREMDENDKNYIQDVVVGTVEHIDQINALIDEHSIGWKTNRISKVNQAIMRLAIYEMLKREDIPHSVSINEAVELAKTYDGEQSAAFVNGVLGAIQKRIE